LFLTQNSWIQHIQPGLHSGSTTQGISIAGIAPSPIPLGCWYDMFWCFIQHVLRENPSKKTGLLQPSRVIRDRSMTARRFFLVILPRDWSLICPFLKRTWGVWSNPVYLPTVMIPKNSPWLILFQWLGWVCGA
jgi:hypothetical protein